MQTKFVIPTGAGARATAQWRNLLFWLLSVSLCLCGENALAQDSGVATHINYGSALPANAPQWSYFTLTDGSGLYQCQHSPSCTSSGQWAAVGSGGSGGGVFPVWASATSYSANAYIVPPTANGHYYKNTAGACTSNSSAPTFSTSGGSVSDNTCTWLDEGAAGLAALGNYLNLAGGTMTGSLTLAADPVTSLQASTRHYVDTAVGALADQALDNLSSVVNINITTIGITSGLFVYNTDAAQDFDSQTHRPKSAYFANNVFAGSASGSVGGFVDIAATATPTVQNGASWHAEGPYNATSAQSSSGTFAIVVGTPPGGSPSVMYSYNGGGSQTLATLTSSISGNAATATALAATPAQCTGNQVSTGIAANGNANCAASNVINLQEVGAQTAASGYGTLWFSSSDHLLHANDSGTNLTFNNYANLANTALGAANTNTVEEYAGTNPQAFYLYQTEDGANPFVNYSRVGLSYDSGSTDFVLSSSWGGTGGTHPLGFGVGSTGTVRWEIPAGAPYDLRPSLAGGATNTEDIGDATHQVRNLYLGTGFYIGAVQVTGMTSAVSGNLMTAGTVAGSSKVLCTDASGNLTITTSSCAVTAAQLPNPTASTLGGVESIVSTSHQWIAYIDTSGVPHQSQPASTDLSDVATLATLASPTFSGTPSLPTGTTGVTQSETDTSTKLATTGFVKTLSYSWTCPVLATGYYSATGNYCYWQLPAGITVTGLDMATFSVPTSCSTYPILQLWDATAAAQVGSYGNTLDNSTTAFTHESGSTNVTSAHVLRIRATQASSGCSGSSYAIVATVTYTLQ